MTDDQQAKHGQQDVLGLSRMTSEQFSLLNDNIPTTPTSFRHSGAAAPMTLKEQEKVHYGVYISPSED